MLPLFIMAIEDPLERSFYAELFLRYQKDMYQSAYSVTKNSDYAEDAVQMVFMKIIESRFIEKAEKNDLRLKAYLCTAAKNAALNLKRDDQYYVIGSDGNELLESAGYEPNIEANAWLSWALSKLPEGDKLIVLEYYYYGLSSEQIAKAEGISNAAVRQRLSRIRGRLKERLGDEPIHG